MAERVDIADTRKKILRMKPYLKYRAISDMTGMTNGLIRAIISKSCGKKNTTRQTAIAIDHVYKLFLQFVEKSRFIKKEITYYQAVEPGPRFLHRRRKN